MTGGACWDDDALYALTGRDLYIDFEMEVVAEGAPDSAAEAEDLSDVDLAEVAIRLRVPGGPEASWDTSGSEVTIDGNVVKLRVDKTATIDLRPGVYDGQLNFNRSSGLDECALQFVLVVDKGVGG